MGFAGRNCPRCGRPIEGIEERVERGRAVLYAKHTVAGKPILCPLGRKEKALAALGALSQPPPSEPPEPQAPPEPSTQLSLEGAPSPQPQAPEPLPAPAAKTPSPSPAPQLQAGVAPSPQPRIAVEEYIITRYIMLGARVERGRIVVPWGELNRVFISLSPHLAINFTNLFRLAKRVEYTGEGLVFRTELS